MSETARQTAERVVSKLLDGDVIEEYSSHEEFEERPGGPKDPHRQTTVPMHFPKGSFTGKRPKPLAPKEDDAKKPHPRFQWKPQHESDGKSSEEAGKAWHQGKVASKMSASGGSSTGSAGKAWHQGKIPHKTSSQGAHSAMGNPSKAWHQGTIPHKTSSQGAISKACDPARAWKPGWEKGDKGEEVAGKPGAISYKEALMRRVLENIKTKKAMKMGKSNSGRMVAGKPGKVQHEALRSGMKGIGKKKVPTVASAPGKVKFGKK